MKNFARNIKRLKNNDSSLSELNLSFTNLSDKEAKILAEALKKNTFLKKLSLFGNKISAIGVKYITDALETNKTLSILRLENNVIGDEGAKYVANFLGKNKTLTSLRIAGNHIFDSGIESLAKGLEKNKTLIDFTWSSHLGGNVSGFYEDQYTLLMKYLHRNRVIHSKNIRIIAVRRKKIIKLFYSLSKTKIRLPLELKMILWEHFSQLNF